MADNKPEVAVIMGSASDWETMKHACEMLDQFEVPYMTGGQGVAGSNPAGPTD